MVLGTPHSPISTEPPADRRGPRAGKLGMVRAKREAAKGTPRPRKFPYLNGDGSCNPKMMGFVNSNLFNGYLESPSDPLKIWA